MKQVEEEFQRKLISPEEAANLIKSGDRIVFPMGRETSAIGLALSARKEELKGVRVYVPSPSYDFGWYDPGWEDSFELTILMPTATADSAVAERRCDVKLPFMIPDPMTGEEDEPPDVVLVEISPPNEQGYCSFGASLWDKKRRVEQAKKYGKLVIAEVNENLIRTGGDNFVHISQIDYLVEHISLGGAPGTGSLAGRVKKDPPAYVKQIAEYVGSLIKDRDTIQIGVGRTNEYLVQNGMLDGKHDLGFHSEATPPGIISLIREGVITGKYKNHNPGRVTVTSVGGSTREEMAWVNGNPIFQLVDVNYLEDIRLIADHDNFVAINQTLAVDLTGQIASEGIGHRFLAAAGGQIPFVFGALLSKGGRSIITLPSTATTKDGVISRIMATLPPGTPVTIQRNCADYIVTEYGIASLRGKTIRQRVRELLGIAHPDFRAELEKEAKRLYWA
ncbi:4-hydroxybutyrate CoA-transferase [Dehalococcoidia bacterium]|nr:4-hydroxybutyrate CoA-transferase [Dehalococcoidia bacterium]